MVVELSLIERTEARAAAFSTHGLVDGSNTRELTAEALRRAASLRCPSTPNELLSAVKRALGPLFDLDDSFLAETLDLIIGLGDLVEWTEEHAGYRRRTIYLGSPRFIKRESGDVLLLVGVRPDAAPLVGDDILDRVEAVGHTRRLKGASDEDIAGLIHDGLREITDTEWLRISEPLDAQLVVDQYGRRLASQPSSGDIAELQILDLNRPTSYYRGRWRSADNNTSGRFVGRRGQGFGADLWCYVQVQNGVNVRFLDLPLDSRQRGCDEAWRLQAAIDAANGNSQNVIVERTGKGLIKLGLTSPPPRWLQRRWDLIGEQTKVSHALFAYEFSAKETRSELRFVADQLWMTPRLSKESK